MFMDRLRPIKPASFWAPVALFALFMLMFPAQAEAQGGMQTIPLDDLSAFVVPEGSRWETAGHVELAPGEAVRLVVRPGDGVLVNRPDGDGADIRTEMEHGDLDLSLDFMMAEGSNSGIYLQGRYEIQLLDSWGVERPRFGDCGGLYERWDPSRGPGDEGYEGRPPRLNACGAPGVWQHLELSFQAPRFEGGEKVENARLNYVRINGVTVHEDVELTGATRGALTEGGAEIARGPLRFQGDHGPVAFRNIRYQAYDPAPVELSNLSYELYAQPTRDRETLSGFRPERQGEASALSWRVAAPPTQFTMLTRGTLELPRAGAYRFDQETNWTGAVALTINGRPVPDDAPVELAAGAHDFELLYAKLQPNGEPVLGLFASGPGIRRQPLHADDALPVVTPPGRIFVEADARARVVRSFARVPTAAGPETLTHAVFVGHPNGAHYTFDAGSGALAQAWRGPFLDATPMWNGRGGNPPQLIGNRITLATGPPLAVLSADDAPWPADADDFRMGRYTLDPTGVPTFYYRLSGLDVTDEVRPAEGGRMLTRTLAVADALAGLHLRIAAAPEIERLSDGRFAVDSQRYLVEVESALGPFVRMVGGMQELLVPVTTPTTSYTIIW